MTVSDTDSEDDPSWVPDNEDAKSSEDGMVISDSDEELTSSLYNVPIRPQVSSK